MVRIDISGEDANGATSPLLTAGSALCLISPAAERLRFPLPASGAVRLRVTLVGEDRGYLEPGFSFKAVRSVSLREPPAVELEALELEHRSEHSVLVVARPRGLVPNRLRLETSTGAFNREITVWDEGAGADLEPLGKATLLRIDGIVPIEVVEMTLGLARGDRLRLVIRNHDSPPLENIGISAVVPQPVLFFSLPETGTAKLCFGGARAHRPRYDLTSLIPALGPAATGEGVEGVDRALTFLDPDRSNVAALAPVASNREYDPAPALAFAMHPGAELAPGPYSHQRKLQLEPSPEGLARLRLGPEDLALVRDDLADLRVIDGDARQWAYLLEHGAPASVDLGRDDQRTKVPRHETVVAG